MTLDLITTQELQLSLDPVASEERFPSVAFNIEARFSMPFQHTAITIKECWFSHTDLNKFEEELRLLCGQEKGRATLRNMDGMSIVSLKRHEEKVATRIHATDTVSMGKVVLTVAGYPGELRSMLEKIREYPKWW